ncbi:hypothetical protein MBLNU230_g0267t1 [Neophaeotheca triangularis]
MSPQLSLSRGRISSNPPVLRLGLLTLILLIGLITFLTIRNHRPDAPGSHPQPHLKHAQGYLLRSEPPPPPTDLCTKYPDRGDIAIVVKTSAPELDKRLPTMLVTSLACVSEPLILSDLQQKLGEHTAYDIVSGPSSAAEWPRAGSMLYSEQQRLVTQGREREIPELELRKVDSEKLMTAAGELDRLKFLRMLGAAWELRPDRRWYVFLETDVYLAWPNLLEWLGKLDAGEMLFYGSVGRDSEFMRKRGAGTGSSGALVLSGEVVKAWNAKGREFVAEWEEQLKHFDSGESLLEVALQQGLGLNMSHAGGAISAHSPNLIPFNPGNWCQPLISLHNTTNRDQNTLHQVQAQHPHHRLLHRDVFKLFHPTNLPFKRENHDNLSDDPAFYLAPVESTPLAHKGIPQLKDPHRTYDACALACQDMAACKQFSWTVVTVQVERRIVNHGTCFLSEAWRLGVGREKIEAGKSGAGARTWTAQGPPLAPKLLEQTPSLIPVDTSQPTPESLELRTSTRMCRADVGRQPQALRPTAIPTRQAMGYDQIY